MSEANMSPDASPGTVSKKTGVRRVNNMPMMILGGVLVAFVIVMMLVAADRSSKQNAPATGPKERAGNTSVFAREIAGEHTGGMIEPSAGLVPPVPAAEPAPIIIAKPNLDMPPPPPTFQQPQMQPVDDEANRIRQAKLQMLEEAIRARTVVQGGAPRSPASSGQLGGAAPQSRDEMLARMAAARQEINRMQADDPTAAYQARLEQIRKMGVGGG